jgi:quaternary ammonium compound-resistance protein SugE
MTEGRPERKPTTPWRTPPPPEESRMHPPLGFVVGVAGSMAGLGDALRTSPVGTGYAVWVGIGAATAALAGILLLGDSAHPLRVMSLLLVVAGVVGLKLFH